MGGVAKARLITTHGLLSLSVTLVASRGEKISPRTPPSPSFKVPPGAHQMYHWLQGGVSLPLPLRGDTPFAHSVQKGIKLLTYELHSLSTFHFCWSGLYRSPAYSFAVLCSPLWLMFVTPCSLHRCVTSVKKEEGKRGRGAREKGLSRARIYSFSLFVFYKSRYHAEFYHIVIGLFP